MNSKVSLLAVFCMLAFSTCTKDIPLPDTDDCKDAVWAEGIYHDASSIMDEAATSGSIPLYGNLKTLQDPSGIATISVQNVNFANVDTIIVDFGTSDVQCSDKRFRRGKILAIVTRVVGTWSPYADTNAIDTIKFVDYYVNDNHVEGSRTIYNNYSTSSLNKIYKNTTAGKITNRYGKTMTWNATEKKTWTNTVTATSFYNRTYAVSGTASGTGFNGTSFTSSTTTDLTFSGDCYYIKSGVMTLTPSGFTARTLDFGPGSCDKFVDVLIDGNHNNINQE